MNEKTIKMLSIGSILLLILVAVNSSVISSVEKSKQEERITSNIDNINYDCPCKQTDDLTKSFKTKMIGDGLLQGDPLDFDYDLEYFQMMWRSVHMNLFGEYIDDPVPLYKFSKPFIEPGFYKGKNLFDQPLNIFVIRALEINDDYGSNYFQNCNNDNSLKEIEYPEEVIKDINLIVGVLYTEIGHANITGFQMSGYNYETEEELNFLYIFTDWDIFFADSGIKITWFYNSKNESENEISIDSENYGTNQGKDDTFPPPDFIINYEGLKICLQYECPPPGSHIWKNTCEIPDNLKEEAERLLDRLRNCFYQALRDLKVCAGFYLANVGFALACILLSCATANPSCVLCLVELGFAQLAYAYCQKAFWDTVDACRNNYLEDIMALLCEG